MFTFQELYKIFKEIFWNFLEWLHERDKIYTSYGKNDKCYVKYVFWKVFKSSTKFFRSPVLVILETFFTWRALKGKLGTQRALQKHSRQLGTQGNWALEYSSFCSTWQWMAPGHSGTWSTQILEHSGTQRALRHAGTESLGNLRHSTHFI